VACDELADEAGDLLQFTDFLVVSGVGYRFLSPYDPRE
jgi:hypothetical protein